ncbi:MAG: hypothetical protein JHC95_06570 [Solirubrobacteraceae bacterium]|nr:hypothetical protein [Solirubrobacteraceae bacterium]
MTRLRRPAAALALGAATLALAGCSATGTPEMLPDSEAKQLASASEAIEGACARGPLTPAQETALLPRVTTLVDATKKHPDTFFTYEQEDENPLISTPSLELAAVVGTLGGVGPQRICSPRLAAIADRGLIAAGKVSMLHDMPSARE